MRNVGVLRINHFRDMSKESTKMLKAEIYYYFGDLSMTGCDKLELG